MSIAIKNGYMKIDVFYIRKYSMMAVSKERISETDNKKAKLLP